MSFQQDLVVLTDETKAVRPTVDYVPSFWGDQFLDYNFDEMSHARKQRKVEELKEEVRRELVGIGSSANNPLSQLSLIDAILRLDVAYHFEKEIEQVLQHIHTTYNYHEDDNLYNLALYFRLLRQNGFKVSSKIFKKLKDDKENFRECIITDVAGMLGLYEAAQLRVHGENILDEAFTFTSTQLESIAARMSNPLATQVKHALKQQLRKGIPRLEAKHYLSIYQDMASHSNALLRLAKLDFHLVQSLHRKELSLLTRWWKDLGLAKDLSFARDRLVESYMWSLAVYFEPQYCLGRKILTKAIAFITIIDDVYDAYGTIEELTLFTKAIERWDINNIDHLPIYMQVCCRALFDFFNEIEDDMEKERRTYRVHYAKEAMKAVIRGYLKEAQWVQDKYSPTVEEHINLAALVTSVCTMLLTFTLVGMGEIVTEETFYWLSNGPKIVTSTSIMSRLMDDIAGHKFEQKREHLASSIECYMKQHGVSMEEAYDALSNEIVNHWKDINEECLRPSSISMSILTRVLNYARVTDVIYKDEDSFTHVGEAMKNVVTLLLIDPAANDAEDEL